jgi:hypothetical protein
MLVVHAPSRAWIVAPEGHYVLRGRYGFGLGARRKGCAVNATVSAILVEGERRTILFERNLDTEHEEDLLEGSFAVAVDPTEPAWIQLTTATTRGNEVCAWTYWKSVRLE